MINPRLGALCLVVNSSQRSAKFYSDVFGMEFAVSDCDGHAIYSGDLGGVEFTLVPRELSDVRCTENKTHWDVIVDDLDRNASRPRQGGPVRAGCFGCESRLVNSAGRSP